jgi:hypothetical protein
MNLDPLPNATQVQKKPIGFDPEAFTRALRISGAVLVVAAASTFMLQNWVESGNDLIRYAMLVTQSLFLFAVAWFVGITVRESRSARTLLALVLATVPICFTVCGALLYSQVHPFDTPADLPSYVRWIAPTLASALLAVGVSLLILVPLSFVSFMAFARKRALSLTVAFLASISLLLIPVRIPDLMIAVAGVALVGLLAFDQARLSRTSQLDTLEGRLARVMPFIAPLIVIGRVVYLYQVRLPFLGGLLLVAASMLWLMMARVQDRVHRDLGALGVAALSGTGWMLCWIALGEKVDSASLQVLLLGVPAAVMFFVSSLRAELLRKTLASAAAVVGLGSTLVACASGLSTISALICIVSGTVVAVCAAGTGSRIWTVCGAVVALYGVGSEVWLAVHEDNIVRWVTLTVTGISLIVGAAYVERNRVRVQQLWERWHAKRFEAAVQAEQEVLIDRAA